MNELHKETLMVRLWLGLNERYQMGDGYRLSLIRKPTGLFVYLTTTLKPTGPTPAFRFSIWAGGAGLTCKITQVGHGALGPRFRRLKYFNGMTNRAIEWITDLLSHERQRLIEYRNASQ